MCTRGRGGKNICNFIYVLNKHSIIVPCVIISLAVLFFTDTPIEYNGGTPEGIANDNVVHMHNDRSSTIGVQAAVQFLTSLSKLYTAEIGK